MFSLIVIAILILIPALALTKSLALGDSLALGFGQASGLPTRAVVGISSCRIARMVPREHLDFVFVSAGTNDPPGRCVEAILGKLDASRVVWVVPVNGARGHVIAVAKAHGDGLFYYTPSKSKRVWPHPNRYRSVFR